VPSIWAGRERAAINRVDGILKQAGLDQEAIAAQTLALKLDTKEARQTYVCGRLAIARGAAALD
jgi:hypothetical protein